LDYTDWDVLSCFSTHNFGDVNTKIVETRSPNEMSLKECVLKPKLDQIRLRLNDR
jgi:hypothetical protein